MNQKHYKMSTREQIPSKQCRRLAGPSSELNPSSVVFGFSVPLDGTGNDCEVMTFLFLHFKNAKYIREPLNVNKTNKTWLICAVQIYAKEMYNCP